MDLSEESEAAAFDRDRRRKWWQAKERPINNFERAPLLCLFCLAAWALAAIGPAIILLLREIGL